MFIERNAEFLHNHLLFNLASAASEQDIHKITENIFTFERMQDGAICQQTVLKGAADALQLNQALIELMQAQAEKIQAQANWMQAKIKRWVLAYSTM